MQFDSDKFQGLYALKINSDVRESLTDNRKQLLSRLVDDPRFVEEVTVYKFRSTDRAIRLAEPIRAEDLPRNP